MNTPKSKLQFEWDLKSNLQIVIGLGVILLMGWGLFYKSPSFRKARAALDQAYALLETSSKQNASQALPLLNEAAGLTPQIVEVYTSRGYAYELLEEYERATDDYSRALSLKAGDDWTYVHYVRVLLASGQTQQALKEAKRFSALKPQNVEAQFLQGTAYYRLKMYPQALQNFDKALEIMPDGAPIYLSRAQVFREQGENKRAQDACNAAIRYGSGEVAANAYITRGIISQNEKNLKKALADYNAAIKADPRNALGFLNRGALYLESQKYSLALKDLDQAIAVNPKIGLAFYNRGYAYWELEKFSSAFSDFNQAIKLYPKHAPSYFYRAQIFEQRKEWQKAIADYTKALPLDKTDGGVRLMRARAYFEFGNAIEAERDYTFLIHQKKQLVAPYAGRGLARLLQFRDDEARQDFAKARAIDKMEENKASAAAWQDFDKTIAETKVRRSLKSSSKGRSKN